MKRHVPRAVASQLSESRPQGGGGQLRWPLAAPAGPHETGLPGETAPLHRAQQREPSVPDLLILQGRRELPWPLENEGFGQVRGGRETAVRTQREAKIPVLEGALQTSTRAFRLTRRGQVREGRKQAFRKR